MKRFSKWLRHERGYDEWTFDYNFDGSGGNHQPQDLLTREERRKIRQASLVMSDIPARSSLTAEERQGWRTHISNVLGKSYSDITREDWARVDGWKVPSLVGVSLDAGLLPHEVARASMSWVDLENRILRIPKEDSAQDEMTEMSALIDERGPSVTTGGPKRSARPSN